MNTEQLSRWLNDAGVAFNGTTDRGYSIGAHALRSTDASLVLPGAKAPAPTVFVGYYPKQRDKQVHAFGDTIHWFCRRVKQDANAVHLVIAESNATLQVLDALGSLQAAYRGCVKVHLYTLDAQKGICSRSPPIPDFGDTNQSWSKLLHRRTSALPEVAQQLKTAVGHGSFEWYQNLSESGWSGRADGLELCELHISEGSYVLELGVGTREDNGARPAFNRIMGGLGCLRPFRIVLDTVGLATAQKALVTLVEERQTGSLQRFSREHRLEARVLRGEVGLARESGADELAPLSVATDEPPFQFPARWSLTGSTRHIDVLAREPTSGSKPDLPWVVELKTKKTPTRGRPTEMYRQAVTQAVLYREYLRNAKDLHFWFKEQNLDPSRFQAAVAFPRLKGARIKDQAGVFHLATDFGVEVIELRT